MKSCLNFSWSIILSLNKGKLKELAMLLHDFVNNITEDFFYFQWYLALIDIVETWFFVNKWGNSKSAKSASE